VRSVPDSLPVVPTTVQVTPGVTSVARMGDVVAWYETDESGGGVMVTQILQLLRSVANGAIPHHQLGSRVAALLTTGDQGAVPALVAAVPVEGGLQVVVHGWGAVVADGLRIPNGWLDEVIPGRQAWWIGRNTATPVAPTPGASVELHEGVVPGSGAGISYEPDPPPVIEIPDEMLDLGPEPEPADLDPPVRVAIDDGRVIELTTGFIVGSAPDGSRAVRQGLMEPLHLADPGGSVRPVHAELRVFDGRVAIVDATDGATHVLVPGATEWALVEQGKILKLQAGTRVAVGTRILHFQGD
jgi:hypothetical protein